MQLPNFIGPSNTLAAITAAADRTVNMYEEAVPPGMGKGETWLRNAPGLELFAATPGTSVRQLFAQDGRAWAVSGDEFIELFSDGSWVSYGAMATVLGIYPTISSNGTAGGQLFITSGLNGYIFDTVANTLTLIADADFPQGQAAMGEFMDGYFLVLIYQSRAFQISALEDGTSWDGLDIAERSEGSDNVLAMKRSHREIWLLGTQTGEVWFDNGDPGFPFAPVQGVFVEQGVAAMFALQRIGNTVMWVSMDADGNGIVNIADGYSPKRISTFAVEDMLQQAGPLESTAWTYQERGHWFYSLHMPLRDDATPVYDLTMDRWDERGVWDEDNQQWHPNRPVCHAFAFGTTHLVGDVQRGAIYRQRVDIYTQDLAA